ncbi:MAG: SH3 domain-containing protein [Clostridia bacterium]|nr:SH3 domain-containing protein [Clostridia bacterium]
MKRTLATILTVVLTVTALIIPAEPALADTTAYVIGGWLRLRATPSFDSATIGSFYTGTAVTVLGVSGSWYNVRTPNNTTGYMYSAYLSFNPPGTPSGDTGTAKVYASNGRNVNLRNGPGLSYQVIGTYSVGTTVTILSRGSGWHYIRAGKQTGYMMAKYLVERGTPTPIPPTPPVPTDNYTAYVYATNGKPVNLRAGAGKNTKSIALIPVGTTVTVLQHGPTWDYISVNGKLGYMMTCFLVTTQPGIRITLTGASLNYVAPVVGQTLVPTLSPAGATAQLSWYNSAGQMVGQGASYTVRSSDVGFSLMVVATGTGNTQGTVSSSYTGMVTTGTPVTMPLTGLTVSPTSPKSGDILTAQVQPSGATASYIWYRSDSLVVSTGATYYVQPSDVGYRFYCVAQGTGSYTGTVYSNYTDQVTNPTPVSQLTGTITIPVASNPYSVLTPMLNLNSYQVKYDWQLNGVSVGSGETLYITEAMVNKSVQLVVTAINGSGYTGSVVSNLCFVKNTATSSDVP